MAAKKKVKTKDVSLSEFHAWLEGVEEMQSADWAPSKDQWKTIREKINNILVEESPEVAAPVRRAAPVYATPAHPAAPSILQDLTASPAQQAPANVNSPKTPDIDTSDGEYKSGFV